MPWTQPHRGHLSRSLLREWSLFSAICFEALFLVPSSSKAAVRPATPPFSGWSYMAPAFIAIDMLTMGRAWVSTKRRVTPFLSTTRFGSILGEARDVEAQRSIIANKAGSPHLIYFVLLLVTRKSSFKSPLSPL